ncbi:hypothetical protein C2G38_2322171 [Gigaspora rosea]|nr:hypothetical protein C2G38_2322171 [Gigaspora rosea]
MVPSTTSREQKKGKKKDIIKKQGKKKKKDIKHKLKVLNEEVGVTHLPTGYSTGVPPLPFLCDNCYEALNDYNDGTVLICGHGYHWHCYNQIEYGCRHCEQYYKKGINKNIKSFLERLEKGENTLTKEDGIEESEEGTEEDTEEPEEIQEIEESDTVLFRLQNALENINKW